MRREITPLILLGILVFLSVTMLSCGSPSSESTADNSVSETQFPEGASGDTPPQPFPQDDFDEGYLDLTRWEITSQNDFAKMILDVYDVNPSEETDYRLRLGANTIGTSDETVKFLGVRSLRRVDFSEGRTISFELDWNNQANGCYLSAGIYLCPAVTDINPRDEANWIAFQYVGVPPGKNARFQVARKNSDNLRFLFTEGWPDEQRTGREIARQHVELIIDRNSLRVVENGEEVFYTEEHGLGFTQAYLYLQMSSHSNYPTREIYFDNIMVQDTKIVNQVL